MTDIATKSTIQPTLMATAVKTAATTTTIQPVIMATAVKLAVIPPQIAVSSAPPQRWA